MKKTIWTLAGILLLAVIARADNNNPKYTAVTTTGVFYADLTNFAKISQADGTKSYCIDCQTIAGQCQPGGTGTDIEMIHGFWQCTKGLDCGKGPPATRGQCDPTSLPGADMCAKATSCFASFPVGTCGTTTIPAGSYECPSGGIVMPTSPSKSQQCELDGQGGGIGTSIHYTGSGWAIDALSTGQAAAGPYVSGAIKNLRIDVGPAAQGGIRTGNNYGFLIDNVEVDNANAAGQKALYLRQDCPGCIVEGYYINNYTSGNNRAAITMQKVGASTGSFGHGTLHMKVQAPSQTTAQTGIELLTGAALYGSDITINGNIAHGSGGNSLVTIDAISLLSNTYGTWLDAVENTDTGGFTLFNNAGVSNCAVAGTTNQQDGQIAVGNCALYGNADGRANTVWQSLMLKNLSPGAAALTVQGSPSQAVSIFAVKKSDGTIILEDSPTGTLTQAAGGYFQTLTPQAFSANELRSTPVAAYSTSNMLNGNSGLTIDEETNDVTRAQCLAVKAFDSVGALCQTYTATKMGGLDIGLRNGADSVVRALRILPTSLTVPKAASAPGTAPGAGNCATFWVPGTNAGTCKLQAECGTSSTPVTIVDNVGGSC